MSKKLLETTTDNRTYKIILKRFAFSSCLICQKRTGIFYAECNGSKIYGFHGNGKRIYSIQYRNNKSWKNYKNKQWNR